MVKRVIGTGLFLLIVVGYVVAERFGVVVMASTLISPPKLSGVVQWQVARDDDTGRDVTYAVYLPPSYRSSEHSYPVIFHLHGADPLGRDTGLKMIRSDITLLTASLESQSDLMPESIIVAPYDSDEFSLGFDAKGGEISAEKDLLEILISSKDVNYRVDGRCYIQRFSMGVYGAVKDALKYPDLFIVAIN
ncbi:alpha/beta hydrolase-fold protein [Microbulbifer sp. OS29]|uniref:Alpha/beta hydrolase-fold protein n=1 Tax=Microbulbifer okhotskensis TaxID=2926617 RepID=A0A9X2J6D1_9GAMM|nr:alpha/beta hydrolase-fold protein [Microbulbifer okhotskensis]MCO1335294.1 alpha/beta hydrolase-fold protein [Microbulbifer okhotskensis]